MATSREIKNWMVINREDYNTATELAEGALATFPTHQDEAIAFDLAQEIFYADEN